MKKTEIELAIASINNIKEISNKLNYNDSSKINQNIINVLPVLTKELDRLNKEGINIRCPQLKIITTQMASDMNQTLEEYTNLVIQQICENEGEILDFDLRVNSAIVEPYVILKYQY